MAAANRQFPGLFGRMMLDANEASSRSRDPLLRSAPRPLVNVTEEMHRAASVLARKLAKGIFYNEAGAIFPGDGCLVLCWFTNTDLLRDGKYPMFDVLKDIAGSVPVVVRSGNYLHDQFEYKLSFSDDKKLLALQGRFGNGFGIIVFGATTPGLIEGHIEHIQKTAPRDDGGPFRILQSTLRPLGRLQAPHAA